jgi:putative NADH-flavin reductase
MYKNILILGAETSFGIYLTHYLLSLNYFVTILINDKKLNKIQNFNLEIIEGNLLDYETLRYVVAGQQIIINVVNYKDYKIGEISVISQNIIHAINANYVDKYIGLAPIGSGQTTNKLAFINKALNYLKFITPKLNEYTFQESLFSNSAIDYTIVQVGQIVSKENEVSNVRVIPSDEVKNLLCNKDCIISENILSATLHSIMITTEYNKTSVILATRIF